MVRRLSPTERGLLLATGASLDPDWAALEARAPDFVISFAAG